jgi:hypothetical protein
MISFVWLRWWHLNNLSVVQIFMFMRPLSVRIRQGPSPDHYGVAPMATWVMSLRVGAGFDFQFDRLMSRIGADEWGFGEGGPRWCPRHAKSLNQTSLRLDWKRRDSNLNQQGLEPLRKFIVSLSPTHLEVRVSPKLRNKPECCSCTKCVIFHVQVKQVFRKAHEQNESSKEGTANPSVFMGPYTVPNSLSTSGWEDGIHLWCNDISDNRGSELLPNRVK